MKSSDTNADVPAGSPQLRPSPVLMKSNDTDTTNTDTLDTDMRKSFDFLRFGSTHRFDLSFESFALWLPLLRRNMSSKDISNCCHIETPFQFLLVPRGTNETNRPGWSWLT